MNGFALSSGKLRAAARAHAAAAATVDGAAPEQPGSVDGGEGTPHVLLILADLGADADALARLNDGTAVALTSVADTTDMTDCEAAARLRLTDLDVAGGRR
ncbi:MAG: hypothetical protein ACRCYX_03125 [Dermatophilaceae bacterium]